MSSVAKLVVPEALGTTYRWCFGNVTFEVDAGHGARVIGFRFGNENILTTADVNTLNFGSTFWTSPQSDWNWPPVTELDSDPYTTTGSGVNLWFQSAPGPLGIAVAKQFRVNSEHETVEIEYVMENRSDKVLAVAPWEITRLPMGGLTFFPALGGVEARSKLKAKEAAGAVWFDNDPGATAEHQKVFAGGSEGWVAHVDIARRMLLIKTFPSLRPGEQAPGEAEIELYANPAHTYVEIEQQGPYRPLEPGQRSSWTVTWRLRRLPVGIAPSTGNKDLLALVRALKARDQSSSLVPPGERSVLTAEEVWRRYDSVESRLTASVSERMLDLAGLQPGMRVLDLATGRGEPAIRAATRVGPLGRVVGVEISDSLLQMARERADREGLSNLDLRVGNAEVLKDIPTSHFHVATVRWGLMYLTEPVHALAGVRRALLPGGVLVAALLAEPERMSYYTLPRRLLQSYRGLPTLDPEAPGPFRYAGLDRIVRDFNLAGFTLDHVEEIEFTAFEARTTGEAIAWVRAFGLTKLLSDLPETDQLAWERDLAKELEQTRTGDVIRLGGTTRIVRARPHTPG